MKLQKKNIGKFLFETIENNNASTTLGTLYATDILRNPVDHPFSCMVNKTSEQETVKQVNPNIKLVRNYPDSLGVQAKNKYLKYKAKYLELKEKIKNHR